MTKPMTEEARWQRLRELQKVIAAKRRLDPPREADADQWVLFFEDEDDEHGHTVKRGIKTWLPKPEVDELYHLRFRFDESDDPGV